MGFAVSAIGECPRSHPQLSWQTGAIENGVPVGVALRGESGAIGFRFRHKCEVRTELSKVRFRCYLVAIRLTGGGGAAAGEMTNVSHVFQPVGRSKPPNSA
jgi:hypothetical protein